MSLRVAGVLLGPVVLSGCALFHPVGESALIVQGRLAGRPAEDHCELMLFREGRGAPVRTIDLPDTFDRTLTVAPGAASYYVTIRCMPSGFGFTSKTVAVESTSIPRLDLGTIQVRRP